MRAAVLAATVVCGLLLAGGALAEDAAKDGQAKILVTFADPGMSNAARAGPPRPGYGRRATGYLVSLPVKRAARRIASEYSFEMIDDWPIVSLKVFCQVYVVAGGADVDALLARLRARPEVESAQRLNRFEVSGTVGHDFADPYLGLQHNFHLLQVDYAHAWSRGDGSLVTVIDTGADIHHPDLERQVREHRDFVNRDDVFEDDAHGTAIAGVIGASSDNGIGIVGIAPSARIDILKACWYVADASRAVCDTFTLAKALNHAIESDTDVINLSIGGPPDALLGRLVEVALNRGILVVAAASATAAAGFPTDVPGVMVISSTPRPGGPADVLSAPGHEILVPVPGGGFDYASGSSLSAAQVSGIGALLRALQPDISQEEVRRLLAGSRSRADQSVNACRALARLLSATGCLPGATAAQSPEQS